MSKPARTPKPEATPDETARIADASEQAQEIEARTAPTQEEIAQRAYQIFLERGGVEGNDIDDWLQAERDLTEGR